MLDSAVESIRGIVGRLRRERDAAPARRAPTRRLHPEALHALGLARQPFDDHAAPADLFVDDAIRMQLNMLSEQLRSGAMLPLLRGETGSGKTSLLILLMTQGNDEFHYFVVRGAASLRASDVIQDMLRLMMRPTPTEPRAIYRELVRRLRGLVADGRPAVLVVDDAEAIPDIQLNNLLEAHDDLRRRLDDRFRLLLAAEPAIELRLPHLASAHLQSGHVTAANMRPLARPRVGPYLQHRLAAAGLAGALPFDEAALDRIAAEGGGLPRSIETAAAAELNALAAVT